MSLQTLTGSGFATHSLKMRKWLLVRVYEFFDQLMGSDQRSIRGQKKATTFLKLDMAAELISRFFVNSDLKLMAF